MKKTKYNNKMKLFVLLLVEVALVFIFFSLFLFPNSVFAGFGEGNVTAKTNLTVGNSAPVIKQILVDSDVSINLIPNDTKTINCTAIIEDYDTDSDVTSVTGVFFNPSQATSGSPDDNNSHYTNSSCRIDTAYGDTYELISHCLFDIWYYANASEWNCSITATDTFPYQVTGTNDSTINPLLALTLPDIIQYGTVNATEVSIENVTNVTNIGNVMINLSLNGYGFYEEDGNAMNCTLGPVQNISVEYEKFNLTSTTPGNLTHQQFIGNYTNLTSNPVTRTFNLGYRKNENYNEAWNHSYWRIYVPTGVAGTCQGNIIFGAVQANGV
jgi:hypothetical protein